MNWTSKQVLYVGSGGGGGGGGGGDFQMMHLKDQTNLQLNANIKTTQRRNGPPLQKGWLIICRDHSNLTHGPPQEYIYNSVQGPQ